MAHLLCDPRSFVQNLEKSTCKQMSLCEHANICSIILASSSMSRWKTCNILCANDLRIKYGKYPYQALCCKRWHNRMYSILIVSARSFGQMKDRKNHCTVETLYSTIYYSKYFIELNFDKSTEYVALWTHKRHPIPRPFGRAMECLLWVIQQKLTVL